MPVGPDPNILRAMPLFERLSAAQLTRLNELLHVKAVPGKTNLMLVEQPAEVVYIILAGTVKVHVEQLDGSDVILAILGPGEIVGEMGVADRLGRSASVVTLEDSRLLWLDQSAFRQCLRSMPELAENLLSILSRRLRVANERIQALSALDVYGRVARQVLVFSDIYGQPSPTGGQRIAIKLSQSDLASLVGASRVRVNQVLSDFRQRGHISLDEEHRITVHDTAALAAYVR